MALLLAWTGSVQAGGEPAMRIRHWQREDGMPQGSGCAITQTPDGYIWVATYSGLTRFDGRRFTTFEEQDSPVQDLGKTALQVSPRGELLVTNLQGGLYAFRDGKFVRLANFPGHSFEAIAEDAAGDIWLINDQRAIIRARDGLEIPFQPQPQSGWSMLGLYHEPGSAEVWALRDRTFGCIREGRFTARDFPDGEAVHGMGPARERGFWLIFANRLERWVDGQAVEKIPIGPWPEIEKVSAVAETADGRIAVGTNEHGLFFFDRAGNRQHYDRTNGLADNWVMSLYRDQEGSLWVGMANKGLDVFQPVTFATLAPPDQWGQRGLTHTLYDEEGLWVGTEGAGLYRWAGGEWGKVSIHPEANQYVWTMARDGAGNLWLGTWGGGLYERRGAEFIAHPEIEANYQTPAALLRARDGSFWAGSEQGLFQRANDMIVASYGREQGVPLTMITCLAEGPDGAIWFGTSSVGLGRLLDGVIRFYHVADGLPGENIKTLHFDEHGALWIGSDGAGLSRFKDGIFTHIGPADGLKQRYIIHILDDGRGSWWLSTREGVIRLDKASLFRRVEGAAAPLELRVFTTYDGLPLIECSGRASMSPAGDLFFPTRGGLARTHPDNVVTNLFRPAVLIESLSVGGQADYPDDGKPVAIPPGSERYVFSFTAPSFVATGTAAFRYRLEGVDKDWVVAGADRTATYSFLPPGEYQFQVYGSNGHGIWNERPATMQLIVLPFFWQTWWFQALAYLAAALVLGLLTIWVARRRWAKELIVLERKQALERERARIAKDIHDDLGANLTRISLLTQSAQRELATQPGAAAGHLAQIGRTTREMTKTMDEIVWAVNPSHDSLDGIATYVAAYAQDFLGLAGIACRWSFPLSLPPWPVSAEVRHNLFLAIKEALHNVACHAQATRVDLALQVQADRFGFTVTDNGVGGAWPLAAGPTRASGGGNGIRNMRLRLQEIGGECLIASEPGKGTSVHFTVPLKPDPATHD